jgi:BppU N-terminal domain
MYSVKFMDSNTTFKQGDTIQNFQTQIIDQGRNPVNLTNATVKLRLASTKGLRLDKDCTIDDVAEGIVSFSFDENDVTGFGRLEGELYVKYSNGGEFSAPTNSYLQFNVHQKLTERGNESVSQNLYDAIVHFHSNFDELERLGISVGDNLTIDGVEQLGGSSGVTIDDASATSTTKTWSAQKINNEISSVSAGPSKDLLYADDFAGANDTAKIQAAIDFAVTDTKKKVMLANRNYAIAATVFVKPGVELIFDRRSQFWVYGDFNVIEVQKNASLINPYIAIDDPAFTKAAIYLDGKHKYLNTWNKAKIQEVTVINTAYSYTGIGIHCYANGNGHEISFVNFDDVKIVGMNTAVKLEAIDSGVGYSYINANRFDRLSLDDCVNFIEMSSNETIPNECSGNSFLDMQIQPSANTQNVFTITGQFNVFRGMCWDMHLIPHSNPVVNFTVDSMDTTFEFPMISASRITNSGARNTKPATTTL